MVTRSALSLGVFVLIALAGSPDGQSQETLIRPRPRVESPGRPDAEDRSPPPNQGPVQVVVLHNDSALQGQVEKQDDRLIVSNGPWYVVRVRLADVDFVAPDFAAAYRTKRGRINERDFQRHLQLAQWCLRHDLDRFAADELLHLSRLDPHHSAVDALEKQLRRRANTSPDTPPDTTPNDRVTPAIATGSEPQVVGPLPEPLPPISPATLAEFTRSIQPLLLNRCGQTTCHGNAGQNAFQLQRLRAGGVARKDLTLRNLRSAIAQIDASDADQTSLLEHATRAHGQGRQAPFGPHEAKQYERLLAWVNLAARGEASIKADAGISLASAQQRMELPERAESSADRPAAPPVDDAAAEADAIDPYDPANFNARFADDAIDVRVEP